MRSLVEQNPENRTQAPSARSLDTAEPVAVADDAVPLPTSPALPDHLQGLAAQARGYVAAASSANTRKAYASDWKHFAAWCRRQGLSVLPPDPQVVGLYITACASGSGDDMPAPGKAMRVATIERRLSSLCWTYAQRGGERLDRKDRHIATVMAGIRNRHAAPPHQKAAILAGRKT